MRRPAIGITTYYEPARWGVWQMDAALLPADYPRMVQRSGGLAVLLPPDAPAHAETALERVDGLVVAGGADVDPARYAETRHPRTGTPAPERDAWELALIEAALRRGTPLLGICRGMQLLNVARGGTLIQHLPDTVGHDGHAAEPGVFGEHRVLITHGTRLATVIADDPTVPTYHHQAVAAVGEELRVSARAEDGTVEALEWEGGDGFALGVEWHPERGDDLRLTRALVEAALARSAEGTGA